MGAGRERRTGWIVGLASLVAVMACGTRAGTEGALLAACAGTVAVASWWAWQQERRGLVAALMVLAVAMVAVPAGAHTPTLTGQATSGAASTTGVANIEGTVASSTAAFTDTGVLARDASSGTWATANPTTTVNLASRAGCSIGSSPSRTIYHFSAGDKEVAVGTEGPANVFTWAQPAVTTESVFSTACFNAANVYAGQGVGKCEQVDGTATVTTCVGLDAGAGAGTITGLGEIHDNNDESGDAAAVYATDKSRRTRINGTTTNHPNAAQVPRDVECVEASFCIAVGDNRYFSQWNGATWTNDTVPADTGATTIHLKAVACVTPASCFAVGDMTTTPGAGQVKVRIYHWTGATDEWHNTSVDLPIEEVVTLNTIWIERSTGTGYIGGNAGGAGGAKIYRFATDGSGALTYTGCGPLCADVATDYKDENKVYVRAQAGRLFRFDQELNPEVEFAAACEAEDQSYQSFRRGMTYARDNVIGSICGFEVTGQAQLSIYHTSLAVRATMLPARIQDAGSTAKLDSGLSNTIAWASQAGAVAVYDSRTQQVKWVQDLGAGTTLDLDVDQRHGDAVWATGSSGTFGFTANGEPFATARTVDGTSIAANGSRAYVSDGSGIDVYGPNGVSLTLVDSNASYDVDARGLVVSKDGRYLAAINGSDVSLINTTNLETLLLTTQDGTVRDVDMDVNNNYLYVLTDENVFAVPIYDVTCSDGGCGTNGSLNPDGGSVQYPDTILPIGGPTGTQPSAGSFLGMSTEFAGLDAGAGAWFIGLIMVVGFAGGLFLVTQNALMGAVGGVVGFGCALAFGLIPVWFMVFVFALVVIGIVVWARG